MKDKLVSFTVGKLAKEKGFNIKTKPFYNGLQNNKLVESDLIGTANQLNDWYPAPTQSLLRRWLREVHGIIIEIDCYSDIENSYYEVLIYNPFDPIESENGMNIPNNEYRTYEEALERGLVEALKLITMEKLIIENLAPYLPYKLQIRYFSKNRTMNCSQGSSTNWISLRAVIQRFDENCKPILRPLSDLTKEIEVNGEKFIPCEKFGLVPNEHNQKYLERKLIFEYITFREMQLLISWHFDVFGLIEKGLAIDINTLNDK